MRRLSRQDERQVRETNHDKQCNRRNRSACDSVEDAADQARASSDQVNVVAFHRSNLLASARSPPCPAQDAQGRRPGGSGTVCRAPSAWRGPAISPRQLRCSGEARALPESCGVLSHTPRAVGGTRRSTQSLQFPDYRLRVSDTQALLLVLRRARFSCHDIAGKREYTFVSRPARQRLSVRRSGASVHVFHADV